eukprot:COSAG06_NODE_6398_length_2948_cov_1.639523_5_plen_185_part_01
MAGAVCVCDALYTSPAVLQEVFVRSDTCLNNTVPPAEEMDSDAGAKAPPQADISPIIWLCIVVGLCACTCAAKHYHLTRRRRTGPSDSKPVSDELEHECAQGLQQASQLELEAIESILRETITDAKVERVERNFNDLLYGKYSTTRKEIEAEAGQGKTNERWLWNGNDRVQQVKEGFDIRHADMR